MDENPYKAPSRIDANEVSPRRSVIVQILNAIALFFGFFGALGVLSFPLLLLLEMFAYRGDAQAETTFTERCLLRAAGVTLWLAIAGIAEFAKRRLDRRHAA